jgi:hypothetical protein
VEPALTGSLPDKPADKAKPPAIEGWVLRDVYDGMAMIENRNRRGRRPASRSPGLRRDQALGGHHDPGPPAPLDRLDPRGRTWVVVTTKGLITPQTW